MAKYRKKPVVVNAFLWTGKKSTSECDYQFIEDMNRGIIKVQEKDELLLVETLEGAMICCKGDYLIRGIKGEYYPCKPDIFKATYEQMV